MIDADVLNKAGISYKAGMERFLNDAALYEAVLSAFADENIIERAQAAFDIDDRAKLLEVVHEAKGSGGNAGLELIYTEASALVTLLRASSYTDDELTQAYERFKAAYLAARKAIRAALR